MKSFIKTLSLCFCMMIAVVAFSSHTQAASLKNYGTFSSTKTLSADVTHDGKSDTIKFVVSKRDYYISTVKIYVNGKLAITENDSGSTELHVQYLYYSKAKEFLYLYGVGESGMPYIQHVYSYNKSTKKFTVVCDLTKYTGACKAITSIDASNCSFKVRYGCKPMATAGIYWNYTYKFNTSTQKFKLVRAATKAKCKKLSYDPRDGLTPYFNKSMLKTNKSVTMYTSTSLSKTAFTVPYGKFVTLVGITTTADGNLYAKFKYGSKYGWLWLHTPRYSSRCASYDTFQGVSSRSAGGFYS